MHTLCRSCQYHVKSNPYRALHVTTQVELRISLGSATQLRATEALRSAVAAIHAAARKWLSRRTLWVSLFFVFVFL